MCSRNLMLSDRGGSDIPNLVSIAQYNTQPLPFLRCAFLSFQKLTVVRFIPRSLDSLSLLCIPPDALLDTLCILFSTRGLILLAHSSCKQGQVSEVIDRTSSHDYESTKCISRPSPFLLPPWLWRTLLMRSSTAGPMPHGRTGLPLLPAVLPWKL